MGSLREEILADGPYRYWPMNDMSPCTDLMGGPGITLSNGVIPGVAGMTAQMGNAHSFDGIDDFGRILQGGVVGGVDLSDTNVITVEFALLWDAHGTNDDLASEHGDSTGVDGGFLIDPNDSGGATQFAAMMTNGAGGFANKNITAPTAAVWHHFAFVLDRPAADADQTTFYVDGSAVAENVTSSQTFATNFGNWPLNFMCRTTAGAQSLYGAGDLQHYAIYKTALSAGRIAAHYAARNTADAAVPPLPIAPDYSLFPRTVLRRAA